MRSIPLLAALWLAAPPAPSALSPEAVGRAIAERRSRVEELRVIREAAQELGFRVWLFGGTAAGFAHYVRNDLAREAGDARFRESFFDYDFTNIYRSTQDADLVVDATPEQAGALEKLVQEKMSFLQGSKEHWEVRLLRYPRTVGRQVKLPLLANPDFLEQHTDSNSTGMIELTDPPPGESVVRDLRDWKSPVPFFLKDVAEGRLHYYWSATHEGTSRFQSGDNPPLFSVIRYLVKAFQYDLTVEGEDLEKVKAIIDAFDPNADYSRMSSWARGWLERYGPNLIRHSVNIEYAWNTLEKLGLREKLIALSDPKKEDSLGWWLFREPLRTEQVGEGNGKTAAQLGIDIVAHETGDFLAYESITRDTTLRPNVLISRPSHPGETAASGPGFYTRRGREGAAGTGLTIRFQVDPRAREGADFTLHGDYVLVTNRAALTVIPESLDSTWPGYFELLRAGAVNRSDRGAWMKLKRRLSLRPLSPEDEDRVAALVAEEIEELGREPRASPLLGEWFALPASANHPELLDALYATVVQASDRRDLDRDSTIETVFPLVRTWFALPVSREHPELVTRLIDHYASGNFLSGSFDLHEGDDFLHWILELPGWGGHPELIRTLLEKKGFRLALELLARADWSDQPELVLEALDGLQDSWSSYHAALFYSYGPKVLQGGGKILWPSPSPSSFWKHPQIVRKMVTKGSLFQVAVREVLTERPERLDHPELILALIEALDEMRAKGEKVQDQWIDGILKEGGFQDQPRLRALCGGGEPTTDCLRRGMRGEMVVPPAPAVDGAERRAAEKVSAEVGALGADPGPPEKCWEDMTEEERRFDLMRRYLP